MAFDNLPKINERKSQSNEMQLKLEIRLREVIRTFGEEYDYKFLSYEVDNVLLGIVKKNHELYLRSEYGNDMVG